jgi:hypothetical protein
MPNNVTQVLEFQVCLEHRHLVDQNSNKIIPQYASL